jgi:hypothetical protein
MISQSGLAATEFYQEMSGEHKVVNADSTHGALSTYFFLRPRKQGLPET